MKYALIAPNGHGNTTDYKECLPSEEEFEQMYKDGVRLYVDGKKQTRSQSIDIIKDRGCAT